MDRWREAAALFEEAVELPRESRSRFLDVTCGGDLELRREVEELLAADAKTGEGIAAAIEREARSLLEDSQRSRCAQWKDANGVHSAESAGYEHCWDGIEPAYGDHLRIALTKLADCFAAAGQLSDATCVAQEALDRLAAIGARRALRPDEVRARDAALARLAEWRALR